MPMQQSVSSPSRPAAPRMAQSKGMAYKGAITSTSRSAGNALGSSKKRDRYRKAVGRSKRVTGGASTFGA